MSFIEGIGDDFLYALIFLIFLGIVSVSWLSTHVNNIHSSPTLFVIERRNHRRNGKSIPNYMMWPTSVWLKFLGEESETISPTSSPNLNEQSPTALSTNEILTEHDSDIEYDEFDHFAS